MKRLVIILPVLALILMMGACADKEETKEPAEETTVTTTTTQKQVDYRSIYAKTVDGIIDEYGQYTSDTAGLHYGRLVDMDADKIPEMLIIHDMVLEIYAIEGDDAACLYSKEVGSRYGQTDSSGQIMLNTSKTPVVAIDFHSESEWTREDFDAITITDGEMSIDEYHAATDGENDTPDRGELQTFSINGSEVSQSDYEAAYEGLTDGAEIIDACNGSLWMADEGYNYVQASSEQLQEFIDSLRQ